MAKALVTGASSGIGLSIAKLLSSNNITVYNLSRTAPKEDDINFIECDVTKKEMLINAFQKIYEKHDFVFSSSISSYMILPSKNTAFFSVLFLLDKQFAQKTRTIGRLPMQKRRQISSRTEREKFSHKKKARQ